MGHEIRDATPADGDALRSIYAPYVESSAVSFESEVPSASEMRSRIQQTSERFPWLVYESPKSTVLGYAYGSQFRTRPAYRWSVETTVYVDTQAQGRGAGTKLYRALLELLRLQGFQSAYAGLTLPNAGSQALHARVGFERVGTFENAGHKFGAWHDVEWWRLKLRIPPPSPAEVTLASALRGSEEWKAILEGDAPVKGARPC